jgi:hypothetical protein
MRGHNLINIAILLHSLDKMKKFNILTQLFAYFCKYIWEIKYLYFVKPFIKWVYFEGIKLYPLFLPLTGEIDEKVILHFTYF